MNKYESIPKKQGQLVITDVSSAVIDCTYSSSDIEVVEVYKYKYKIVSLQHGEWNDPVYFDSRNIAKAIDRYEELWSVEAIDDFDIYVNVSRGDKEAWIKLGSEDVYKIEDL